MQAKNACRMGFVLFCVVVPILISIIAKLVDGYSVSRTLAHSRLSTCLSALEVRQTDSISNDDWTPRTCDRNLPVSVLMDRIVEFQEGIITANGSVAVNTGKYTGRSPDDRYIVDDDMTHHTVDWGKVNKPFPEDKFNSIHSRMQAFIADKDVKVFDGFVGADPNNRIAIRVITDTHWQSLFARQLFIRPTEEELKNHVPDYTVISMTGFQADPSTDKTNSNAFVLLNLSKKLILIGTTQYAGEIKKSMFSVMNYLLPQKGVLPMHCSANVDSKGNVALFFGLSGTGKTTLSADPSRYLIGDDEHGGCYAKCVNLKQEAEPQIWNAITTGAVLENVVIDPKTNLPLFDDQSLTENTRVAYPLNYIPGAVEPSIGNHPSIIIFLTADAFGVLPPIARLTNEGAMYHFLAGYTSKLAGTERGITSPTATFSECFGSPFMPLHASEYAKLLGQKLNTHKTQVYMINTGWTGGIYGVGKRMNIAYTRAMVAAALSGELDHVEYHHDELFNLDIPLSVPNVPANVLNPKNTWTDKKAYDETAETLAKMFVKNFQKFGDKVDAKIIMAGPKIL